MTLRSSGKLVSSSRNLKINFGFPFLNKEEKTELPNSLWQYRMSKSNKS